MIPAGYSQALADYADSIGDVTPLEAERDALYTKKLASDGKGGKELIGAELNNKKFGFQVTMTVEEKFTAFVDAIKIFKGTKVVMTYGAWSRIVR